VYLERNSPYSSRDRGRPSRLSAEWSDNDYALLKWAKTCYRRDALRNTKKRPTNSSGHLSRPPLSPNLCLSHLLQVGSESASSTIVHASKLAAKRMPHRGS
jgi:hypothetical protein